MRPGATRVESIGSVWWFDEAAGEYLRLPRNEQPREHPEWSDERAGALQDAVWHPYADVSFTHGRMYVWGAGGHWVASAPMP